MRIGEEMSFGYFCSIVSDSLKESESIMDTEMLEDSSILSEVNRQTTVMHEQLKMSMNNGGRDMMSMADAAEAARRDKIDEVAHTLTENRVLQRCKHPFLTVSKILGCVPPPCSS
ncbi:unnamed protein product [Onchocerca flexuosa]|uniref:t-SNARE coiled-coil homology domain-containing protein n=1 Tax=Onchocerca flexuosa TaxID=387005 RepID=A0A183HZC5_9BILA|nr:unnamed protein product [Onchocerca flexuosa]